MGAARALADVLTGLLGEEAFSTPSRRQRELHQLLREPAVEQEAQHATAAAGKLLDARRYPFLFLGAALSQPPTPAPPEAALADPPTPSSGSCSGVPPRWQSRGAGGAWPSPRFCDWLPGTACPVVDCAGAALLPPEALGFVERGAPCILRGLSVFPAAMAKWSFNYFSKELLSTELSVFDSADGNYSYWYGKPNNAGFAFAQPTEHRSCSFHEFLRRRCSRRGGVDHCPGGGGALAGGRGRGGDSIGGVEDTAVAGEGAGLESLYLQDMFWKDHPGREHPFRREIMGKSLMRDWEHSLSWETLAQVQQAGRLGGLTTSSFFCSGVGAYSRPHYDQNSNLYLQVRGAKRWLLFAPEDGAMLYAYPKGHPLDRKSRLDFEALDLEAFPGAAGLRGRGVVAELWPGDVLWAPSHWWHAVESLEPETLSLNFWWNPSDDLRQLGPGQAMMELSRDVESVLQATLGAPSVETFLSDWHADRLPGSLVECRLRCLLLARLVALRHVGRLPGDAWRSLLRLLDPRRYTGLRFERGPPPAPPSPAPPLPQPQQQSGQGAEPPAAALRVLPACSGPVRRVHVGRDWEAAVQCRKGSANSASAASHWGARHRRRQKR